MAREALIERNTKETQIRLQLNIDGTGSSDIDTGIGFFDHMLDGFTRHGLYDLTLRVHGDLNVDDHHTIEDTGIVLGNAIREAVGDKKGIKRYGSCILPMDEVLVPHRQRPDQLLEILPGDPGGGVRLFIVAAQLGKHLDRKSVV